MTPHGHAWLSDDPDEVPLLVTPGFDGAFNLRFSEEYRDEILALLDESDLKHSTAGEFSATVDLLIESVSMVGPAALGSLAFVIRTLVHRHDKKKFVLKRGVSLRIRGAILVLGQPRGAAAACDAHYEGSRGNYRRREAQPTTGRSPIDARRRRRGFHSVIHQWLIRGGFATGAQVFQQNRYGDVSTLRCCAVLPRQASAMRLRAVH